jgi:hypothetical protein
MEDGGAIMHNLCSTLLAAGLAPQADDAERLSQSSKMTVMMGRRSGAPLYVV